MDFSVIWQFREALIGATGSTLVLTIVPGLVGIVLGILLCAGTSSKRRLLRWPSIAFSEAWRNTPILVQAIWVHFALPVFTGISTSPFQSGLITLSLNAAAYFAEIIRSGIDSVGKGQFEAAQALGLRWWPRWMKVILPQAIPNIIPPLTNSFISLLKATAALSIIAVDDIMKVLNRLNSVSFRTIELYTVGAEMGTLMRLEFGPVLRAWPVLLDGLFTTLWLSAVILAAGALGGLVVCMLRLSGRRWLEAAARAYIGLFRTIPEMVLLFWIYYCLPLLAGISVPTLATGVLALTLVASAYLGEIFRTGVGAIPLSQFEAGRSLGIPEPVIWWKIVMPQALRVVAGPVVNYTADIVKNTSLLAAIGIAEIIYTVLALGSRSFRYFEFVTVAGLMYFAIIFPLSMYARSRGALAGDRKRRTT